MSRLQRSVEELGNRQTRFSYVFALICIALGVSAYVLIVRHTLHEPVDFTRNDPAAYLRYAEELSDAGGPLEMIRGLFSGSVTQANQHPLYIMLLSLDPTPTGGQRLSMIFGALTLLLVVVFSWRTLGPCTSAIVTVLLGTNGAFCYFSTLVTCESLLVLLLTFVWVLIEQSDKTKSLSWFRSVVIGILLGFAYLTKGTGPLFLAGVVGCLMLGCWRSSAGKTLALTSIARWKSIGIVMLSWFVISSPLLVRNVRVYGNPLYNVNSYFMYMDDFVDPGIIKANGITLAETREEFFRTHSVSDLIARESKGIGIETYVIMRSLGPAPYVEARVFIGLPLFAVGSLVLLLRGSIARSMVLLWLFFSILLFAWYIPIATGPRFTAPLIPIFSCLAAHGISSWTHASTSRIKPTILTLILAVYTATWTVLTVAGE